MVCADHGLKLNLAGFSSYVLERQRGGWKIVLMDFDLQPIDSATVEGPKPASPSIEGAWMLESSKNLTTGQARQQVATMVFTKTWFSFFAAAPDRRQPKDKRLSDYSRKELQEITREADSSTGTYRIEGNKVILTSALTLLPNQAGQELTLENVKVTPSQLSYEMTTPDGRVQHLWRRVE